MHLYRWPMMTQCGAMYTPHNVTTDRAEVTCRGCLDALYETKADDE